MDKYDHSKPDDPKVVIVGTTDHHFGADPIRLFALESLTGMCTVASKPKKRDRSGKPIKHWKR